MPQLTCRLLSLLVLTGIGLCARPPVLPLPFTPSAAFGRRPRPMAGRRFDSAGRRPVLPPIIVYKPPLRRTYTVPPRKPTRKPPVIYFPDGEEKECQDAAASNGFNMFSFLTFVLSVYNLFVILSDNVNNNNNNNNDDDDNDNDDNMNMADAARNLNQATSIWEGLQRSSPGSSQTPFDTGWDWEEWQIESEDDVAVAVLDCLSTLFPSESDSLTAALTYGQLESPVT